VETGSEVGIHYDPMLAKVIARGPDRETALRKLVYALTRFTMLGVQTNREFLIRALEHPELQSGGYHTGFVGAHLEELIRKRTGEDALFAAVAAVYLHKKRQLEAALLPNIAPNYRNNPFRDPSIKLEIAGDAFLVSWRASTGDEFAVACGDWQATLRLVSFARGRVQVSIDGLQQNFWIAEANDRLFLQCAGSTKVITRLARYPRSPVASEHESAFAPMPGQVLKILVEVGQHVSTGDALVILEAMKMEQTLRASADGVVDAVHVRPGDVVAPGDRLVEIAAGV
jgi:acetyl/propionyl-CoA carboxylase alpha subunit